MNKDKRIFGEECAKRALLAIACMAFCATAGAKPAESKCGRVALQTWNTSAEFKDVSVTAADGKVLWSGLPDPAKSVCTGKWKLEGGTVRQEDASTIDAVLSFGDLGWRDYTLRVKARKLSGREGFILRVRERGPKQAILANYGGWGNTDHAIETRGLFDFRGLFRLSDNYQQPGAPGYVHPGKITQKVKYSPVICGKWYDLEFSCKGDRVSMKIDGEPVFSDVEVFDFSADGTTNKIAVDPDNVRFPVPEAMWGIFFEDISLSLDGGLYAEMVRNRSFEETPGSFEYARSGWSRITKIAYWNTVGRSILAIDTSKPISAKNRQCCRVEAAPGGGVANDGYFGMGVKTGAKYRLSVAMRGDVKGPIEVSLSSLSGTHATGRISDIGPEWKTHELELVSNGTDPDAKLVFRTSGGGTFYLDCVSLFPCDTYGKSGIFRKDLMERLVALKPSFLRFPGGCWVEGLYLADGYRWKNTVGNMWERRTQWNFWGNWSSNGVGYHEYLLLAEELGAKPIFCVNCGISHEGKQVTPMDKMGEYVQDALDCIEYANGPVTSKWGALRAANGHPEPFNMEYLEIGNELGGHVYQERFALIHDAVIAKYPDMKILSDILITEFPLKGSRSPIRDEHYYRSPGWFMSLGSRLYDNYPRGEYDVFVGEYAGVNVGKWGSLRAAIGEAAFMCGLERNADVVKLAAFAPLFANANYLAVAPNMIYITTDGNFASPSWNVQKMFSENRGCKVLAFEQSCRALKTKEGMTCRAVAASAVSDANGAILVKAVNCSEEPQPLEVSLSGSNIASASKVWFTGPGANATNDPIRRETMREQSGTANVKGGTITETLPPLSLTVFRIAR